MLALLVALAVGFGLGWAVVRRRLGPQWAAAIVLLGLVVVTAPRFVNTTTDGIRREWRMGRQAVRRSAPRVIAHRRNARLAKFADSRIPAGATYSLIAVDPRTGRRVSPFGRGFAEKMVWLQFELAPRIAVDEPQRWTIVLGATPAEAGLSPRRAFRFDDDWLVER
jgi:hypothetical protein